MKIKDLLKILKTTNEECEVFIKTKGKEPKTTLSLPLQHAYILDKGIGKIELTLEVGETQ